MASKDKPSMEQALASQWHPKRRRIIGVMGSGTNGHGALAEEVGGMLARLGVHLLCGGGRGVMAAVSRAFAGVAGRKGLVIGILPCSDGDPGRPKQGYPNPWIEVPIYTHLPRSGTHGTDPLSRNHINVLSSDAIIALPGGAGTSSEAVLAIRYGRPIVAYLGEEGRIPELPSEVPIAGSVDEVEAFVREVIGGARGGRGERDL